MGLYSIWREKEIVGTADVQRQGMYYLIRCRCNWFEGSQTVQVRFFDRSIELGSCIPQGKELTLVKRVNSKLFDISNASFHLADMIIEEAQPLFDNKPFAYIHRLNHARACRRGEHLCVMFGTGQSNSKPTGQ